MKKFFVSVVLFSFIASQAMSMQDFSTLYEDVDMPTEELTQSAHDAALAQAKANDARTVKHLPKRVRVHRHGHHVHGPPNLAKHGDHWLAHQRHHTSHRFGDHVYANAAKLYKKGLKQASKHPNKAMKDFRTARKNWILARHRYLGHKVHVHGKSHRHNLHRHKLHRHKKHGGKRCYRVRRCTWRRCRIKVYFERRLKAQRNTLHQCESPHLPLVVHTSMGL